MDVVITFLPLLIGWTLDLLFGDPARLPHPIVWFGKMIGFCELQAVEGGIDFDYAYCRSFWGDMDTFENHIGLRMA